MLPIHLSILRSSLSTLYILRTKSTKDSVGWSIGGKKKPQNWKHQMEYWYKVNDFRKTFDSINPKDLEHQYPYKLPDGGIQYFNFVYYPRNEDHEDPKIEPTKLFLVYRRRPLKFRPYWEKHIMQELGLDNIKSADATIVKNIPEINAKLWQVKHLVTIKPLKFPKNFPNDRNPFHYFIQEDGEIIYRPEVKVTENDIKDDYDEKDMSNSWINLMTKRIYNSSLNLDF